MTQHTEAPYFLELLSDNVTLTGTAINDVVHGKPLVIKAFAAAGQLYASHTPKFRGKVEDRELLLYDAVLKTGSSVEGTIILTLQADGSVSHLAITHSPLGGALELSAGLAKLFAEDPDLKHLR